MRTSVFFLCLATGAASQTLRPGDVVLSDAQLDAQVVGRTHTFFDGGKSFFSITDAYTYTYTDGGIAYGRYERRGPGEVCTVFNHGFSRCDTYVFAQGRLVLVTESGDRFPVREID